MSVTTTPVSSSRLRAFRASGVTFSRTRPSLSFTFPLPPSTGGGLPPMLDTRSSLRFTSLVARLSLLPSRKTSSVIFASGLRPPTRRVSARGSDISRPSIFRMMSPFLIPPL